MPRGILFIAVATLAAATAARTEVVFQESRGVASTDSPAVMEQAVTEQAVIGQAAAENAANLVGNVVLNEILADPPPDPNGDANGDGVRSSADDEFVELINHGDAAVDLSGWSLADSTNVRHVFPAGVILAPGEIYVVFGGGTPTGIASRTAVASTGTLSLNNTAETVRLLDAASVLQDAHAYGAEGNGDQSLIRVPDGEGAWTRPHDEGFVWSYSPGRANAGPSAINSSSWGEIKALYKP